MSRTQLLLCLLGISAASFNHVEARSARRLKGEGIIGGTDAKDGQFPYQISLELDGKSICGGSILSERFVITAAHCVVGEDRSFVGKPLKVVAGISELETTPESREAIDVAEVFVPEEFDPEAETSHSRTGGDIAILKLSKDFNLKGNSKLGKIQLPKKDETYAGKKANISGFGLNYVEVRYSAYFHEDAEYNGVTYGKMRYAEANVLSYDDCQDIFSPAVPIMKSHLCAAVVQHDEDKPEGVCTGDSGGPLVYNGTQIGVLSTSPLGCGERVKPAVYTRVSDYVDFINKVVEGKTDESIRSTTLEIPA